MFKIIDPVLSVFILILKVFPKITPNAIYKSYRVAKIFTKNCLEFVARNINVRLYPKYMPMFILSSASTDAVLKERKHKLSAIIAGGLNYVKIIFAFLTKTISI